MNKDIERKRILVIEEAALAIKNLLSQAALTMDTKSSIKSKCISIINDTEKKLKELETDKEFIDDTIRGLKSSFLRWYNQMVASLERVSKVDKSGIVSQTLKSLKGVKVKHKTNAFVIGGSNGQIGMERIEISNLRELMTIYDEGSAGRYVDYVKEVKSAMIEIQDQLASNNLSLYDAKGRQKSIRNMAEIKTRYDLINEDLKKLKDKGSRFVIATAHANASERCSWWQGKIFEIDIDITTRKMGQYPGSKPEQTIMGFIDGKPYYSLKEACENGFLSFNCQHRVVAYYKGVHVPKFNIIEVKKRRDIAQKQRYLENRIRQEKSRQILAISPEERKKAQEKSKQLQDIYAEFCELNEVPRYDWRTRVTVVEKDFNPRLNGGFLNVELKSNSNSGRIEMDRSGVFRLRNNIYIEPMPISKFEKIKRSFLKQGGVMNQDEEAQMILDYFGADGITYNEDTILLRPEPTASEVFEELIHSAQYRKGMLKNPTSVNKLICEIEACKKLVKYQKNYGITNEEHEINKKRLEIMEFDFKEGNYDKYK